MAFLLGINAVRYICNQEVDYIIAISLIVLFVGVFCVIKKYFKQAIALLICLIAGFGWFFVGMEVSFKEKEYIGSVSVVGRVTDVIDVKSYTYQVVLDNVKIDGQSEANISAELTGFTECPEVGSFLAFESELENVHAFTLGAFNTTCYRNGVRYYANCSSKNVVITKGYQTLDEQIRLVIKSRLYENMSEKNAETAYASLFGDKSNVDSEIYNNYQGAGIIHILTISGLHVSFLISLIFGLLSKCRVNRYVNFALTTFFIIFFAYLCNWTPSVLRAGIMGIIAMLSKLLYRKYDRLNSLGIAGFIICLTSPLSGVDSGFLMSVFCVVGINFVMPATQRLLNKIMPKACADVFAVGISAQVGILPILCLMGGQFNILSVFANFLVVPIFGIVFPILFAVSFISLLLPFVAKILVLIDVAFTFIGVIAQFFNVEEIIIRFKGIGLFNVLLVYIASFIISDYLILLGKQKLLTCAVAFLCFAVSLLGYFFMPNKLPTISYISQYNKSSVVIKDLLGHTIVVGDCYLLNRLKEKYNSEFDVFVYNGNITSARYTSLAEMGITSFVSYEKGMFSEDVILEFDKEYAVGSFSLTYLSDNLKCAGVRVKVDELEIFIESAKEISYNTFNQFDQKYDFDLVFASYEVGEGNFKQVSKKYIKGCDYSHNKLGNIGFVGEDLVVRRLD